MTAEAEQPIVAIPTQYKGITFRSKSEARLAVVFDASDVEWSYEPKIDGIDWTADFWVRMPIGRGGAVDVLFEYKPKPPNDSYFDWWLKQAEKAIKHGYLEMDRQPDVCVLLCYSWFGQKDDHGSAYEHVTVTDPINHRYEDLVKIYVNSAFNKMWSKGFNRALNYRFDL